ncbi:hypothetical protein [Wolbachia endosymbiont of Pentidionis agamae]|uniref:hypothetical protein n=1 Tax=Wolbachia endosymbiont of Pentidionis agamae TaxID=3110435 RepID=UPI002FD792E5
MGKENLQHQVNRLTIDKAALKNANKYFLEHDNTQIEELKNENKFLIKSKNDLINTLEKRIKNPQDQITEQRVLEAKLEKSVNEFNALKTHNSGLVKNLDNQKRESQNLNSINEDLLKEITELRKNLDIQKKKNDALTTEKDEAIKELHNSHEKVRRVLEEKLNNQEKSIHKSKKHLEEKDIQNNLLLEENKSLKSELQELKGENLILTNENSTLEQNNNNLIKENQSLREENKKLSQKLELQNTDLYKNELFTKQREKNNPEKNIMDQSVPDGLKTPLKPKVAWSIMDNPILEKGLQNPLEPERTYKKISNPKSSSTSIDPEIIKKAANVLEQLNKNDKLSMKKSKINKNHDQPPSKLSGPQATPVVDNKDKGRGI